MTKQTRDILIKGASLVGGDATDIALSGGVIVEQVSNGVCIRMAALYLLLASEGHSND